MRYTVWLAWTIFAGCCLILFVPFIVADGGVSNQLHALHFLTYIPLPDSFFPFITGKNFAFRILVEILLALYVILALKEPAYRPRSSAIFWALAAFVAWVGIATLFSVDSVKSFWSNFERMDGYITLLHLFALFVITSAVVTAGKWWEKLWQWSVGASALQGVYGLMQVFHLFGLAPSSQSGTRVDTTFGNAIYVAVYMLFNIFLTLYLMMREYKTRNSGAAQTLYGLALLLQLTALLLSETRGAQLGLVGGLIVAGVYILWRARAPEWRVVRTISIGTLAAVVVLGGGVLLLRDTAFIKSIPGISRLASLSLTDTTVKARYQYIWPMAFTGAMERPIVGWGMENFNYVFNTHYNPAMYSQEQWFDRAHNEFLDWLIAAGVPALLLYISLFCLAAWALWRSALTVPEQAVLLGLLAAYGFNNLTVFNDLMSGVYFILLLAFIHSFSRRELPGWLFLSRPGSDKMVALAAPLVLVVAAWGVWSLNAPGMVRAHTLVAALQPGKVVADLHGATQVARDPSENLSQFTQALAGSGPGVQEATEQLMLYSENYLSSSAAPAVRQQFYDLGQSAMAALSAQRPGDARLELFWGMFVDHFGNADGALAHYQKALDASPHKQGILMQYGFTYIGKGDFANGLARLKQAFDLEPSYSDARIVYAAGLYYAGQGAQADQLLTEKFGTVLVDDSRLLQVFTNTKQYDRVVGILEARITADSGNISHYQNLAQYYLFTVKDTGKAIAVLQLIPKINASYAPQVQSIIEQIKNGTIHP